MRSPLTWIRQYFTRRLTLPLDAMYARIDAHLLDDRRS